MAHRTRLCDNRDKSANGKVARANKKLTELREKLRGKEMTESEALEIRILELSTSLPKGQIGTFKEVLSDPE